MYVDAAFTKHLVGRTGFFEDSFVGIRRLPPSWVIEMIDGREELDVIDIWVFTCCGGSPFGIFQALTTGHHNETG